MGTSILVRISSHDEMIGILSLANPERGGFSAQDTETLQNIAAQLALVIENSRLLDRVVQHKRVEQELALAARVQRNLLPSEPPVAAGLEAAAFCRPAREVGGDYYDFVVLEDGTFAFAIGDVAGKGISAAMLMAAVQASLRSQLIEYDATRRAPARMLAFMNRLLSQNSAPEQFVTFFAGFVSADRRRFIYVNAGHNAPLLFHRNNGKASIERPIALDCGGPVLGVLPDFPYEEGSLELRHDDLLVAYTDGLSEALNSAGDEFTEEQIIHVVASNSQWKAPAVTDSLQDAVRRWSAGTPQHDDITCVVLRVASA
jgi:sigma-B regulation protein RsbU (phosphoserine phosphatase)